MSSAQNTPDKPSITLPSLPPLVANSYESGTAPSPEAIGNSVASLGPPHCKDASTMMLMDRRGDDCVDILEETGTADTNDSTVPLYASIERGRNAVLEGDSAVTETECLKFPTTRPLAPNRFTNQNEEKIDTGYDSKGGLIYIPKGLNEDNEGLNLLKQATNFGTYDKSSNSEFTHGNISIDDVKKMNMKDIEEELKKRGRATSGKKEDLVNRLVAAIESRVPVTASVIARHESMTGLDVTAMWQLLTPEDDL